MQCPANPVEFPSASGSTRGACWCQATCRCCVKQVSSPRAASFYNPVWFLLSSPRPVMGAKPGDRMEIKQPSGLEVDRYWWLLCGGPGTRCTARSMRSLGHEQKYHSWCNVAQLREGTDVRCTDSTSQAKQTCLGLTPYRIKARTSALVTP